jgi:phage gp36-like protein
MIYATPGDLVARFTEAEIVNLTDKENIPPSVIDVELLEIKLADAQSFMDGYIGQVYRLPLAGCVKPPAVVGGAVEIVAPPVLTRIACDLARYYLYSDLAPEHEVYRRYQAAIKELEAIAAGKAKLTCPWGGTPGEPLTADAQSGDEVQTYSSFRRGITDDDLRGFA